MGVTPESAVDAMQERFGRHAGYRALHAKGTVCRGTFTGSPAASGLTTAAIMQGEPVAATVRFSNGTGDPGRPDYASDLRGMAVKLDGPDGKLDISAQTAPHFPVRDAAGFVELVQASAPGPASLLRLPWFLARHPRAALALPANAPALKPPASYATCRYHAVHAYRWVDAEGRGRFVRYRWLPAAGVHTLSPRAAKARGRDYLRDELVERLGRAPIRFELELRVAGAGDPTDDPSATWPDDRERVVAGTLEVTGLDDTRERNGDVLVFDPTRVVPGIELSDDPVLRFRTHAYSASIERRTGVPRGAEAPDVPRPGGSA